MKTLVLALILTIGTSFANAQKYAYIDSDFILENVPAYTEAKDKLDKLADRWTKEIEKRYDVLRQKKDNFAREEVLLPKEEKKKRKEEIEQLEQEAMQMQKLRFGVKGDYFQKRQELIKPIQDEVYDAMQEVASKRNYAFVFDKANQSNLVWCTHRTVFKKMIINHRGSI